MNCCYENSPKEAQALFKTEHDPDIIRVEFKTSENEYGLVLDRNVSFTLLGSLNYDEETDEYTLAQSTWNTVTLSFHDDLDVNIVPAPVIEAVFPIIDQGQIDPSYTPGQGEIPDFDSTERWSGVFPKTELNKLTTGSWVIAVLKSDNDDLISRCVFNVLGG